MERRFRDLILRNGFAFAYCYEEWSSIQPLKPQIKRIETE
jgi:hypothetical protein